MKIKFRPHRDPAEQVIEQPIPAVRNLPSWYKRKKPTIDNSKLEHYGDGTSNTTVKWCNPFGDALQAGYQIVLSQDISVTTVDEQKSFIWHTGGPGLISTHAKEQISPELIPEGFNSQPFKFENFFEVITPKGYSSLFLHPLNRPELPFHTLAGIVDTDGYNLPVNFPFVIRQDFEGIIPAGTPIAQVIPFKRDSWQMSLEAFDQKLSNRALSKLRTKLFRAYKTMYWQKKTFM